MADFIPLKPGTLLKSKSISYLYRDPRSGDGYIKIEIGEVATIISVVETSIGRATYEVLYNNKKLYTDYYIGSTYWEEIKIDE
jgi:hypothetical protein